MNMENAEALIARRVKTTAGAWYASLTRHLALLHLKREKECKH